MKTIILAGFALAGLTTTPAMAANAQLEAPLHQFIDNFNKGDVKTAGAAFLPSASIIDEVPPHAWSGATAFTSWAGDLMSNDKAQGVSEEKVTLGAVKREVVSGDTAYVVIAATYSFKQKGAAMHEPAQMTYALKKTPGGWKIAAWTWTGPNPTPVKK